MTDVQKGLIANAVAKLLREEFGIKAVRLRGKVYFEETLEYGRENAKGLIGQITIKDEVEYGDLKEFLTDKTSYRLNQSVNRNKRLEEELNQARQRKQMLERELEFSLKQLEVLD